MNKLKKISWLVVSLVSLCLAYGATANQDYDDWQLKNKLNSQIFLSTKNDHSEAILITCTDAAYLTSIFLTDDTQGANEAFLDYRVDNHSVIFKGNDYFRNWAAPSIWYEGHSGINDNIDKYQTLFQQMLEAKQSLTVNLTDGKGHIYRSANFSVKGLPEALVDFAKQCGTDFQTYSGIDINQSDNHNE